MIIGYEIREIIRPDGRTIWRLVEIHEYISRGSSQICRRYEDGIAAFDTEESAKKYLVKTKRHESPTKNIDARIAEFKANCGKKPKRKIGGRLT